MAELKCFDRWICNIIVLAVSMNIFDLRMIGFSTETAFCLQTLHYSGLTSVANACYAQKIHMITCSEVFTKSFAFQESIFIYSIQICRQVPSKYFCLRGGVLLLPYEQKKLPCNSNMADGQMVPIIYPCYDVGCYPWFNSMSKCITV